MNQVRNFGDPSCWGKNTNMNSVQALLRHILHTWNDK